MPKIVDMIFQDQVILLKGELGFSNVMSAYHESLPYLASCHEFKFDFSGVTDSDSAGLALIIEWIKLAKQMRKQIHFKSVSQDLMSIAKASGLDKFIV